MIPPMIEMDADNLDSVRAFTDYLQSFGSVELHQIVLRADEWTREHLVESLVKAGADLGSASIVAGYASIGVKFVMTELIRRKNCHELN